MRYGGYSSIDEYFQKEEKIYVRNMTKPLGLVSVNFGDSRNPTYFTILKTTVPICLTDFFDKNLLTKSYELRVLIMKGVLELVNEETYRKIVSPEIEEKVKEAVLGYGSKQFATPESEEKVPGVQSAVIQLMAYHTMSEDQRKESMDNIPDDDQIITELSQLDLTAEDKSYILSMAKGKVKNWILRQIGMEGNIEVNTITESYHEEVDATDYEAMKNMGMIQNEEDMVLSSGIFKKQRGRKKSK